MAGDGSRKTIHLGKQSKKQANVWKGKVEDLAAAALGAKVIEDETSRWLNDLPDKMHARLAAVGLVKPRESCSLGPWIEKYIAGRTDMKPRSKTLLEAAKGKLLEHFDSKTPLGSITPEQCSQWREKLATRDASGGQLSEANVKRITGDAKGFFNEAVRRGLVVKNPMSHLASGTTAATNDRYVTPDETEKIINACTDSKVKLLFALARYAGLRTPSESLLLTWRDVDFEKARLNVRSPKTERHAGHERRMVPIVPRLMSMLQDAFDAAPEGQERVIPLRKDGYLNRTLKTAIRRAGIPEWPKLWQTLRSSCEKQWAIQFPQFAVSRWIGHSITVSGKHYASHVPDELFERAAQHPAQYVAVTPHIDKKPTGPEIQNHPDLLSDSAKSELLRIGATGFEPATSRPPVYEHTCEIRRRNGVRPCHDMHL